MDRSCVDLSGGGLRIRLNDDWVKVDKPVAKLLREVVARAGDEPDSRLFSGETKR